jgi:hypothetical protein
MKPDTILVVWYRPFSTFLSFFWSLSFAEIFRQLANNNSSKWDLAGAFSLAALLFLFLGLYQTWLLQYASEPERAALNAFKCLSSSAIASGLFGYLAMGLAEKLPATSADPRIALWMIGGTVLGWAIVGLVAMWYYHVGPYYIEKRRQRLDFTPSGS